MKNEKLQRLLSDRKRFLEKLGELAAVSCTISETARFLGFPDGQSLRDLLDSDNEALQIWEDARQDLFVKTRQCLQVAAEKGVASAVRALVVIMRDEGQIQKFNPEAVTTNQLAELTGRSRQTIHQWHAKHGLPQNADGTFNLREFIPWLENWTVTKFRQGKGVSEDE